MTKPPHSLWGIDRSFDDDASLFKCLPVMFDGHSYLHPTSYRWTYDDDLPAYASQGVAQEYAQHVEAQPAADVPDGTVALVMGPTFARHLQALNEPLPDGSLMVQGGVRLYLVPDGEAERLRNRFSDIAYKCLEHELGRSLLARSEHRQYEFARLNPAHTVIMSAGRRDRYERALLDLIVADLRPDGHARYSRSLALHSVDLRMSQHELGGAVGARIANHLRNALPERAPLATGRPHLPIPPSFGPS
jgi:hypothetical protein